MRKRRDLSGWLEGVAINIASNFLWLILTVLVGALVALISQNTVWAILVALVLMVIVLGIITWSQRRRLHRLSRLMQGYRYEPLDLGADNLNWMWNHPDLPKGRIWLRNVLFDIKTDGQSNLKGIMVAPTERNELRSVNIEVEVIGAESIFLLLNVAHGLRVNPADNLEWEGRCVGNVRLVFRDNTYYETNLVLGQNIRDWAPGNQPLAVFRLTDPNATEVWASADGRSAFDMLRIDIPYAPRDLIRTVVSAQFEAPKNAKTSSLVAREIKPVADEDRHAFIVRERVIEQTYPQIHIIAATCQTVGTQ